MLMNYLLSPPLPRPLSRKGRGEVMQRPLSYNGSEELMQKPLAHHGSKELMPKSPSPLAGEGLGRGVKDAHRITARGLSS